MKKLLLILVLLLFVSMCNGDYSFRAVIDYWLTDNPIADFNKDGIVNMIDYGLIESYGSDEYGLDSYGH